jgi:hypothetical protein
MVIGSTAKERGGFVLLWASPFTDMGSIDLISTVFCYFLCILTQIRPTTAAPTSSLQHGYNEPVPLLSDATESYLPYIYFSGAAYCSLKGQWDCGGEE